MEEKQTNGAPLMFRELPKEQRKALQKEFNQTPEAKKMNRRMTIVAIFFGILVIAWAIIVLLPDHESSYRTFPVFLICLWPSIITQNRFEKWLEAEKNIYMRRRRLPKA